MTQEILLILMWILSPDLFLSDTNSEYINTNNITTIYTILSPYLALSDTNSQYTNTNIITTIYTILSPYLALSDTHSEYTNTNIITTIYMSFSLLHIFIIYFQVFIWKEFRNCAHVSHMSGYKNIICSIFRHVCKIVKSDN